MTRIYLNSCFLTLEFDYIVFSGRKELTDVRIRVVFPDDHLQKPRIVDLLFWGKGCHSMEHLIKFEA